MLTYKKAGVDIEAGDKFIELASKYIKSTFNKGVIDGLGGFAALYKPELANIKEPVLVSSTDGVGTKLKFAFATGIHNTVGIDLVAMCVNDLIVCGARPLFMLDYFATGRIRFEIATQVIRGIVKGCKEAGCALIGGETAEMPSFYADGEYDLAGFAVGIIDRKRIIDGRDVRPGDIIVGVESSGIHSNGYSLVRKIFFDLKKYNKYTVVPGIKGYLINTIMKPTIIYARAVLEAIERFHIKAMAHITGSGLPGNIPRVLPRGTKALIHKKRMPVLPIFRWIQKEGDVPEDDMYNTFNMGIGYVFIVSEDVVNGLKKMLYKKFHLKAYSIGEILRLRGEPKVELV